MPSAQSQYRHNRHLLRAAVGAAGKAQDGSSENFNWHIGICHLVLALRISLQCITYALDFSSASEMSSKSRPIALARMALGAKYSVRTA